MDVPPVGVEDEDEAATSTTRLRRRHLVPLLFVALAVYAGLYLSMRLMSHVLLALLVGAGAGAIGLGLLLFARRTQRATTRLVAYWLAAALALFGFVAGFPPSWFRLLDYLNSGRSPVPGSLVGGIFFVVLGCTVLWAGFAFPRFGRVMDVDANGAKLIRQWTRAERVLWGAPWVLLAGGMICLGLLIPRYAQGTIITMPEHAPLLDSMMWMSFLVSVVAFFPLLLASLMVGFIADERWKAARGEAGDAPGDDDSPSSGSRQP